MYWVPRADGNGREIAGVTQARMDAFSSRRQTINEQARQAAAEFRPAPAARRTPGRCTASRKTSPTAPGIPVVNSGSCREAEFQACQVAGSLPV